MAALDVPAIPPDLAWIWSDADPDAHDQLVAFRTTFPACATARLHVFADTTYVIWCNGRPVGCGPDAGVAHAPRLSTYDLTPFLRDGADNLLAIQVFFEGQRADCSDISALRAGLLGWIEADGAVLPGGPAWRARSLGGLTPSDPAGWRLFANHRLALLDLRDVPAGWERPDFADDGWPTARVVAAHPDPARPTLRWSTLPPRTMEIVTPVALVDAGSATLAAGATAHPVRWADDVAKQLAGLVHHSAIRRTTPLGTPWSHHPAPASHLADAALISAQHLPQRDADGAWTGALPATGADGRSFLLFDFGRQVNGTPLLDIDAPTELLLDLAYGETLDDGRVDPRAMDHSYADRVQLGAGRRRIRLPHDRAFRYLQLYASGAARLHGLHVEEHVQAHDAGERFRSGDPALDGVWALCRATLHQVATSTLCDNVRRERQGWGGPDLALANRAHRAVFGDPRLSAKKLVDFCDAAEVHGFIPCWAPGNGAWLHTIPAHDLWFPAAAREQVLADGDLVTGARLLRTAETVMAWFAGRRDADGLLTATGGWKWGEWALRSSGPEGSDTWENLLAVQAWRAIADLRRWTGGGDPAAADREADTLARAIRARLWHDGHGALSQGTFRRDDGRLSDFCGQVDNALAISLGVLGGDDAARAVAFCGGASGTWPTNRSGWHGGPGGARGRHDPRRAVPAGSPAASALVAEALCDLGRHRAALAYIRANFGAMLDEGDGTAWECWPTLWPDLAAHCRSQGFGAAIAHVLVARIAGLTVREPGGTVVRWELPDLDLDDLAASVRTVHGEVRVGRHGTALTWDVPAGVRLELGGAAGTGTVTGPARG